MKKLKIIVIEDDLSIRLAIKQLLESEKFNVEIFADGKEAIKRLKRNPESCLILLDLIMPVMNGWQFMVEFAKLPVTIVPIPVYLFSATIEKPGDVENLGAMAFIKKPVDLALLLKIVKDHCPQA